MTPVPPGWKCPRRVGFLFPHACDRATPVGCPDCQNGQFEDPYGGYNRYGYSTWDDYDDSYYGYYGHYYSFGHSGYSGGQSDAGDADYDISQGAATDLPAEADFTEADGTDLVTGEDPEDAQFEDDAAGS